MFKPDATVYVILMFHRFFCRIRTRLPQIGLDIFFTEFAAIARGIGLTNFRDIAVKVNHCKSSLMPLFWY